MLKYVTYLNFKYEVYSAVTWINFSNLYKTKHYTYRHHRDFDDLKSLSIVIYWSDATKDSGATLFRPGSHNKIVKDNSENIYLDGKKGTVYLLDTYGLHSGTPILNNNRIVSWIRVGKPTNFATIQDGFMSTPK